jgi:hypothetical protein
MTRSHKTAWRIKGYVFCEDCHFNETQSSGLGRTMYSQIVSSVYTIYFIILFLLHVSTLCGHHQVLLLRTVTLTLDSTFTTLASVYILKIGHTYTLTPSPNVAVSLSVGIFMREYIIGTCFFRKQIFLKFIFAL